MLRPNFALVVALCLGLSVLAFGQVDTAWVKSYDCPSFDYIYDHIQTEDGGFAFTGSRWAGIVGGPNGSQFAWLCRTDENGDTLWNRCFQTPFFSCGMTLFQTEDSGFLIFGYEATLDQRRNVSDVMIIRTTESGDSLWSRYYRWPEMETVTKAICTRDGSYAVAGFTSSIGNGVYDFFLLKLDENCDSLWLRTFGGTGPDKCYDVIENSDGGYLLVGSTTSIINAPTSYLAVLTDDNGDSLTSFTAYYDHWSFCCARVIEETKDKRFILSGSMNRSEQYYNSMIWSICLNSDLESLWQRVDGNDDDGCLNYVHSSCLSSDGSVVLTGPFELHTNGSYYLIRLTPDGNSSYILNDGWWESTFTFSLLQTRLGEYSIAGNFDRYEDSQGFMLLTTPDPNWQDVVEFDTSKQEVSLAVFPNPFNSQATFMLDGWQTSQSLSIELFDICGRRVWISPIQTASPLTWIPADLSAGFYIATVQLGNTRLEKRLLLLK